MSWLPIESNSLSRSASEKILNSSVFFILIYIKAMIVKTICIAFAKLKDES